MARTTLRQRLDAQRARQRRELLVLIVGFALLLGGWLWYHFIYIRTPDYAVKQLMTAVERRDTQTVARYTDLPRILDAAYDTLTSDMLLYDTDLTDTTRITYTTFYVRIKPLLLDGITDVLYGHVRTGDWPMPTGDALTKGRQLGIDFERFLERSKLRHTDIVKIGDFRIQNRTATAPLLVRERTTGVECQLTLWMEQNEDGDWRVVGIPDYRTYLDTVNPRQNRDIADYIAATYDIVRDSNDTLADLQARFRAITKRARGRLTGSDGKALVKLIKGEIIPALKARQKALDAVDVPLGAQYLGSLRHTSTDLAIAAWQQYIRGIETRSQDAFNAAESLKKQEIETDLRITDIIRHNTVSQALPDIP